VLPFLKALNLGYLFGGMTLLCLLFNKRSNIHAGNVNPTENRIIKIIAAWMIISTLFSVHLGHSADTLIELAKTFVLYVGLLTYFKSEHDFDLISGTFFLSSITLTIGSLFKGVSASRSSVGTNYDPNDLALILVCCLPFVFSHLKSKHSVVKALAVVTVISSLIQLVSTQSRMGFLLLLLFGLLYLLLQMTSIIAMLKRLIVLGVISLLFISIMTPQYRERIMSLKDEDSTGSGRTFIWKRGLEIAKTYPLFGVGPGAFMSAYGRMLKEGKFESVIDPKYNVAWKTAHNTYLKILVELGYPGLVLYLLLIWKAIIRLRGLNEKAKRVEIDPIFRTRIKTVEMSLYLFLFGTYFINADFSSIIFILVFLGILLSLIDLQKAFVLEKIDDAVSNSV
jgi:O-antigen ligase